MRAELSTKQGTFKNIGTYPCYSIHAYTHSKHAYPLSRGTLLRLYMLCHQTWKTVAFIKGWLLGCQIPQCRWWNCPPVIVLMKSGGICQSGHKLIGGFLWSVARIWSPPCEYVLSGTLSYYSEVHLFTLQVCFRSCCLVLCRDLHVYDLNPME